VLTGDREGRVGHRYQVMVQVVADGIGGGRARRAGHGVLLRGAGWQQAVSASRGRAKNTDRSPYLAASISSTPVMRTPARDQFSEAGAVWTDLTRIQPRNAAAPSGGIPRVRPSAGLEMTRRR
jgi:hypothetical protein